MLGRMHGGTGLGATGLLRPSMKYTALLGAWSLALDRLVEAERPDVIHSHWAFPSGSAGALVARARGIPLVMTLRGIEHLKDEALAYGDCLVPDYEKTLRAALEVADAITICCSDSRRRLVELGVEEGGRVRNVYHAVDAARFDVSDDGVREALQGWGLADAPFVACVGSMSTLRKGQDTLLDAWGKCRPRSGRDTASSSSAGAPDARRSRLRPRRLREASASGSSVRSGPPTYRSSCAERAS